MPLRISSQISLAAGRSFVIDDVYPIGT